VTSKICENVAWLTDVSPEDMRRIVDALHRVHHLISHITDLGTLLEQIMEESKAVAHAEACSLMLYDPEAEELYFRVALGESGDQQALKREIRLKLNQGIAGAAAARRESINVPDASSDPRWDPGADRTSHFETRSLLAVPLLDKETLVGVLEVVNKVGGDHFRDTDLHVMEMFASLAATAIANARLIEENLQAERLAAVGQAVAHLSHYTKNIITGMSGSVDLIDQSLGNNDLELLKKSWPIFKRSTKRISHFVGDMLAFSKPREPVIETCDLGRILDEVTSTFWGLLTRKQVALEVNVEQVPRPVYVDQQGLYRCLVNLLTNAADAVPPVGGRIRIGANILPEGELEINVADNGPGVPAENVSRIFDPFFSTKGSQGTGLGLAVTRKIVAEHGGEIAVGRNPDGGAVFRIVLPQDPARVHEHRK
jgi:signal transduction histidine kinase